jgi:hypothetical protein
MTVKTDPDTGRFLSSPQTAAAPTAWDLRANTVESLSSSTNGEMLGAVLTEHTSDIYWAEIRWPDPTLKEETRLTRRQPAGDHSIHVIEEGSE